MTSLPRVSIVVPSFNAEKTLGLCLQSVVDQSYDNLELIIIDGASTDDTLDIIKDFEEYITYWVSEKDQGIYDAMNKGFERSTGDWLYFLGADDTLENNALWSVFNTDVNGHVAYGKVQLQPSGRTIGEEYTTEDLARRVICHQAMFMHKDVFHKVGRFDLRYPSNADYALMIMAWKYFEFCYLDVVIARFSEDGFSQLHIDHRFLKAKKRLVKTYLGLNIDNEEYFKYLSKEGNFLLEKGRYKLGLKLTLCSILYGRDKFKKTRDLLFYFRKGLV